MTHVVLTCMVCTHLISEHTDEDLKRCCMIQQLQKINIEEVE